jgi:hypothetical protein
MRLPTQAILERAVETGRAGGTYQPGSPNTPGAEAATEFRSSVRSHLTNRYSGERGAAPLGVFIVLYGPVLPALPRRAVARTISLL